MKIGLLSGSTRLDGSTWQVLRKLEEIWPAYQPSLADAVFVEGNNLDELPLFTPQRLADGMPKEVDLFATFVKTCDILVIATPEYAHNMPAALKSALEWLVASGEFSRKPVLAMTVTPAAPRGDYCLKSLVWTLLALDARVLAEMSIYGSAKDFAQADPEAEWMQMLLGASELLV